MWIFDAAASQCHIFLGDVKDVSLRYEPVEHLHYRLDNTHVLVGEDTVSKQYVFNVYQVITNDYQADNARLLVKACGEDHIIMGVFSAHDKRLFEHALIQAQFISHLDDILGENLHLSHANHTLKWSLHVEFGIPYIAFDANLRAIGLAYTLEHYGKVAMQRYIHFAQPSQAYHFRTTINKNKEVTTHRSHAAMKRFALQTLPEFDKREVRL
jgi:hypothetical protein